MLKDLKKPESNRVSCGLSAGSVQDIPCARGIGMDCTWQKSDTKSTARLWVWQNFAEPQPDTDACLRQPVWNVPSGQRKVWCSLSSLRSNAIGKVVEERLTLLIKQCRIAKVLHSVTQHIIAAMRCSQYDVLSINLLLNLLNQKLYVFYNFILFF